MGIFGGFRRSMRSAFGKTPFSPLPGEGEMPASRDTLSVIHDLSRAVRNNPEAVDIYMALGNLFRSKGDIQHAVLIRERLMARPELDMAFKARASFELGQDYRRAGVVDRAMAAYREAARLGHDPAAVTVELAGLFAESGSFEEAAGEYGKLGHYIGEAHYMVRAAEELASAGDMDRAARLLKKAAKVYPGSVEAWSATLTMHTRAEDWRKVASILKQALDRVAPNLQFLLLENLYGTIAPSGSLLSPDTGTCGSKDAIVQPAGAESVLSSPKAETEHTEAASHNAADDSAFLDVHGDSDIPDSFTQAQDLLDRNADEAVGTVPSDTEVEPESDMQPEDIGLPDSPGVPSTPPMNVFACRLGAAVIPVLEKQEPGILLHYYGGLIFKAMGDTKNAAIWFSKALVVQPHFWAARLELLGLAAHNDELSRALAMQLEVLTEELRHIKRFFCTACGLRQESIFYRCPRCGSWHSISYRFSLQD